MTWLLLDMKHYMYGKLVAQKQNPCLSLSLSRLRIVIKYELYTIYLLLLINIDLVITKFFLVPLCIL